MSCFYKSSQMKSASNEIFNHTILYILACSCLVCNTSNLTFKLTHTSGVAMGGAGRTGRHFVGAVKWQKTPKSFLKNSRENSDCKFHMCLRARETALRPACTHRQLLCRILMLLLTLRETYALNRLSSFKNLRQKGGKFDHRPGRPKVLLRH